MSYIMSNNYFKIIVIIDQFVRLNKELFKTLLLIILAINYSFVKIMIYI